MNKNIKKIFSSLILLLFLSNSHSAFADCPISMNASDLIHCITVEGDCKVDDMDGNTINEHTAQNLKSKKSSNDAMNSPRVVTK